MVAWGCAVGHGLLLPAACGMAAAYPHTVRIYPTYGAWRARTIHGPVRSAAARWRMVRTAEPASASVTTREPAPTREAPSPMVRMARAALPAPTTRARAPVKATRQGSNVMVLGQTGVARGDQWATSSRYTSNVTGNTTRVTQGSEGGAVTRNAPGAGGRSGVARTEGGDVYAGRDGNVHKKDGNNWQKPTMAAGAVRTGRHRQQGRTAQRKAVHRRAIEGRHLAGTRSKAVTRDSAARAEGARNEPATPVVLTAADHRGRAAIVRAAAQAAAAAGGAAEKDARGKTELFHELLASDSRVADSVGHRARRSGPVCGRTSPSHLRQTIIATTGAVNGIVVDSTKRWSCRASRSACRGCH